MIAIGQGEHGYRLPPLPPMYHDRRRKLPRWAREHWKRPAFFAFEEREWRVVATGSHNNTPERGRWAYMTRSERRVGMFVEYALAIPVEQKEERLVESGTVADLAQSLMRTQAQGVRFTPDMLARATHIKGRYA